MKYITAILMCLYLSCANISAQKSLNIAPLFAGQYNNSKDAVVTLIKGQKLEKYKLSLFHSITIRNSVKDVELFETAVITDSKKAVSIESVQSGKQILANYFQLPPENENNKQLNRFILFRKMSDDAATLIYLEGENNLDSLIKLFITKKK